MKKFMFALIAMMMMTFTASASVLDDALNPPRFRHNHSLRYQRFMPRTCPECARIYRMRHHRPGGPAFRHRGPRPHYDYNRPPRHYRHGYYGGPRHHRPGYYGGPRRDYRY